MVVRVASRVWRLSRMPGIEAELSDSLRRDVLGQAAGAAEPPDHAPQSRRKP